MRGLIVGLLVSAAIGSAGACGKNSEPPPPSTGAPPNAQPESGPGGRTASASHGGAAKREPTQAEQMFATVCATCHGMDGTGKGPAADALNPKPRNYTDAAWQASVTDEQLKEIITKGGQAVGKSPLMPGQPQLADNPEVLDGLVKLIRGFGKK